MNTHKIALSTSTYERLKPLGNLGDTFDSVISRLLDFYETQKSTPDHEKRISVAPNTPIARKVPQL